jgi:hypothetical protein
VVQAPRSSSDDVNGPSCSGITSGNLFSKTDRMHEERLVRPDVRDGAHEVRAFGNDMAHGDFIQHVTPDEAGLVLALMDEVLVEVYQSPARVARAQAARQERRAARARGRPSRIAAAVADGRPLYPGASPELQQALLQLMNLAPRSLAQQGASN